MTYVRSTRLSGNLLLSGDLLPDIDDTRSIGATGQEFKDIWSDGSAYLDTIYAQVRLYAQGSVLHTAIATKTANYTQLSSDRILLCNAIGGAFTITLVAASGFDGLLLTLKKIDASVNAITVDGNASETIDGAETNAEMNAQYDTMTLLCDGSNWHIISKNIA